MNRDLIEVSLGNSPADLYIAGGNLINVYSREIYPANIAVHQNKIVYVGMDSKMVSDKTTVISAKNFYLAPGYLEPHAHPWAIYNPLSLMEEVLPLGITCTVSDNLLLFLKLGRKGFLRFIQEVQNWPLQFFWSVRAFPQSPNISEDELFSPKILEELLNLEEVLAIAEITRWPNLLTNQGQIWEKIKTAVTLRKKVEGHTAGASYEKLNSLVSSGIHCCHEAITPKQVQEQLRLGLWVMLRHSSLRPDLPELVKAITEYQLDYRRMMLTSDGPTPSFAHRQGWLPGMLNDLVQNGVDPLTALQMATINPATFYGIDHQYGGIAPGRRADILFLTAPDQFVPAKVIANGQLAAEDGRWAKPLPKVDWPALGFNNNFNSSLKFDNPAIYAIASPNEEEVFPVIEMQNAVITKRKDLVIPVTNGLLDITNIPNLLTICLIDQEGKWITKGMLLGFAREIEGLAASFSTSDHLVVIGKNRQAMAQAAQQVVYWDGGIALVEKGEVISGYPLPLAGMMSDLPFAEIIPGTAHLEQAVKERGYPFNDLLYSLLFFSCDFLPDLRITATGLLQIKTNSILRPSEPF